jgi:hypothetical protein
MTYSTATITSSTPAKDLMAALGTQLTAAGLTYVESYGTPPIASWSSVTFGAGVFVAVATGTATAATSPDGITWTQRNLPTSTAWTSVCFGGGQFVAVATGGNIAATSSDGITWTMRTLPTITGWQAVTYGGGQFVAVSANLGIAATSPDGITWTQRAIPGVSPWVSVAYGAGLFVVVNNSGTAAYSSPDGITWTSRTLVGAPNGASVTFGAGQFVVVPASASANASTSPDGITWTSRNLQTSAGWSGVTYSGSLFVAVSGATAAATSPDGLTWTAKTLPASQTWTSVAYGAGVFAVMPSSVASTALTSPDGTTWTARTLTATSASPMADVYKSPAASNQAGADWYLILRRSGDYSPALFYQVAEGYSTSTHKASVYGGTGVSVIPVPGTGANPLVAATPDTAVAPSASLTLTAATPFSYWVSASANRVVVGAKTSVETGFYAGLYDDLLPAGVTGLPLVCAKIPASQVQVGSIGGGANPQTGGFTREPGQSLASTQNFEACIHNGWNIGGAGAVQSGNFTPSTTTSALYGNVCTASRVMLGSSRAPGSSYLGDALRGLLIGCVSSSVLSVCGDTITTGGKTYVRIAGPTSSYGIFADTSL